MSWKKVLALVTIALAVILLAVVWWVSRYDFNRLKPIIVEQVRAATGREMALEGDLRVRVGLAPTLVTGPVKLSNADWGSQPDMLTVEELEVRISLPALLSKAIVVQRLALTKPMALVEEKADGSRNNWQFDEARDKGSPPPPPGSGAYDVKLEAVDIQDGSLRFGDHQTGETIRLHIAQLALERPGGGLPLEVALEAAYGQNAFSLKGDIDALNNLLDSGKDWAFDLAAKAEQTDLRVAGRLHEKSGEAPHRLEVRITGSRLDIRPWLTETSEDNPASRDPNRLFPTTKLPFDLLPELDLQIEMDIRELLAPAIALQQFKSSIQIHDGRLEAGPTLAKAGGGDYRAHLQIDAHAEPPRIRTQLKIDQMNAEMMLEKLGLRDLMEGVLDIEAELEGQGRSVAELLSGLDGHATLISGQARLGQPFFGLFDEGLAKQLGKLLNPPEEGSRTTPIECLVIRFDSTEGLARLTQMIWVTEDSIVVGGGHVDLRAEKIDIGIQPTPRQGKISLGALTKPFRLGGTLKAPALRIDPTATAMIAGRVAGGLLFGPVGIAMAFSSLVGTEGGNPCLAAVEAAQKGVVPEEKGFLESIGDKLRFWRDD